MIKVKIMILVPGFLKLISRFIRGGLLKIDYENSCFWVR